MSCYGYENTLHGMMITPGEVASAGSQGCQVIGGAYNSNSQYGICVSSDNGGAGTWLSEGNVITGVSVAANSQYGICLYQEDKTAVTGCYIEGNGFDGLYGHSSSYNRITRNVFHNNSRPATAATTRSCSTGPRAATPRLDNSVTGT